MQPKVLVFDIETYGGLKAHMSEVSMFGHRWLDSKSKAEVIAGYELGNPFRGDAIDDKPLLIELSKVWNQADAVVAHYGERFDRRFLNTRLAFHGLPPLKPLKLIDTWRIAKDNLAMHSNRLDALFQMFESPIRKVELTYKEWRAVGLGDKKALKKLKEHCRNDVDGLTWLVNGPLKHHLTKLPNWNLFVDAEKPVCPYCGSEELQKRGLRYQQTSVWQSYQCLACRRWPAGPRKTGGLVR